MTSPETNTAPAQPAAALDAPPSLYRGLDFVELLQLLCLSASLWLIPSALAGAVLFDGFQALSASLIALTVLTVCTMFLTASMVRRLRRGRPYNWTNRKLISQFSRNYSSNLVQHRAGWNL